MSLTYPDDRHYHAEHLWALPLSDGTFRIGITDFAQDQLGGIIFVDLPEVGAHFATGVSCAYIESAKVTSEAIVPLAGTVLEFNEALMDSPELLNTSPYADGWLMRIQADNTDLNDLLRAADYAAQLS